MLTSVQFSFVSLPKWLSVLIILIWNKVMPSRWQQWYCLAWGPAFIFVKVWAYGRECIGVSHCSEHKLIIIPIIVKFCAYGNYTHTRWDNDENETKLHIRSSGCVLGPLEDVMEPAVHTSSSSDIFFAILRSFRSMKIIFLWWELEVIKWEDSHWRQHVQIQKTRGQLVGFGRRTPMSELQLLLPLSCLYGQHELYQI